MNAQKINGGSLEASKRSTKHGGGGEGGKETHQLQCWLSTESESFAF